MLFRSKQVLCFPVTISTDNERVFIKQLEDKLDESNPLKLSFKVNTPENIRLVFDNLTNDLMQDMIETNFNFYKQFSDDREFKNHLLELLFKRYVERINS